MKRLYQADFIRVISTLGIIIYHFSSEMAAREISGPYLLYETPNFSYGALFVTVFFLLSGAMVHYSFLNKQYSVKEYYDKRFFSIFPAFYFVFIILHLLSALVNKSFFFRGHPLSLVLSVFGMDGYFSYRFTTYYQIGEWFLGALVLLYLLYPLLSQCVRKHPVLSTVVILAAYATVFWDGLYQINDFTNLFSCLLSFWIGILLIQHRERILEKKAIGGICTVLFVLTLLLPLPVNTNIFAHIAGIFCFCSFYTIGYYVMKPAVCRKGICFLSMISYPVYLVHHILLTFIMNKLPQGSWSPAVTVIYLAASLVIICVAGYIIYIMVNQIGAILRKIRKKV